MKTFFNNIRDFIKEKWVNMLITAAILVAIAVVLSLVSCTKGDTVINVQRVPLEFKTNITPYKTGPQALDMWICYLGTSGTNDLYTYDIIRNIWRSTNPVYMEESTEESITVLSIYPVHTGASYAVRPTVHRRDNGDKYVTYETEGVYRTLAQDIMYSEPVEVHGGVRYTEPLKIDLKHALTRYNINIHSSTRRVIEVCEMNITNMARDGKLKLVPTKVDNKYITNLEWIEPRTIKSYKSGVGNWYLDTPYNEKLHFIPSGLQNKIQLLYRVEDRGYTAYEYTIKTLPEVGKSYYVDINFIDGPAELPTISVDVYEEEWK